MRSWLGLYLVRLGAWLLHNATGLPLVLTLDFRDEADEVFGGFTAVRYYGFKKEVIEG